MLYLRVGLIILLITGIQAVSGASEVPPESGEVDNIEYHQFVITGVSPIEFYPSDIKLINITVKNVFGVSAYSVSSIIDQEKAEPIKFTHQLQKYIANEIGPEQSFTIPYEIYIKDTIPKGTYYIPVTILWTGIKDGVVKKQEDLYIGIKVAENPEVIKIDTVNIKTIPENIYPGDSFNINISLKNIGNNNINQIRAALDVEIPFSSMGTSTEKYISSLEPGKSAEVSYNLRIDKLASSRLYNFNFTLEYIDYTNRFRSQQSSFGVDVEEVSEVYIQDVVLDPAMLTPESEGILMIQLANAGTNEVKNVRVTVFGGEKILTQTQNFIGIIKPGPSASETTSFGVYIDPDIEMGDYGLNIQVNYDDINGDHHSKSNMYIVKISEKESIINVSDELFNAFLYVFLFLSLSYGIFLIVGFQLDKKK